MIRNKYALIENKEEKKLRAALLEAFEKALERVDPHVSMNRHIHVENSALFIDNQQFQLHKYKNVHVIGMGKAVLKMAEGIYQCLGNRINSGTILIPHPAENIGPIEVISSSHPIPDENSIRATEKLLKKCRFFSKEDLVICLISGGGSALMELPRVGIGIKDFKEITEHLIKSGATIEEINCVRKHLSQVKGGQLAEKISYKTLISLYISDVIGNHFDIIASGPTYPDKSTFREAKEVLIKYGLLSLNPSIQRLIEEEISETPKKQTKEKCQHFLITNLSEALIALEQFLKQKGFRIFYFQNPIHGEAKEVGRAFAKFVKLIKQKSGKNKTAILTGGETTVTVRGKGIGGRNQELALSAAREIQGIKGLIIGSFATDGIDGISKAAGAIIDGTSASKLSIDKYLETNDSYTYFAALDDAIITGPTDTNVGDLLVALTPDCGLIQG